MFSHCRQPNFCRTVFVHIGSVKTGFSSLVGKNVFARQKALSRSHEFERIRISCSREYVRYCYRNIFLQTLGRLLLAGRSTQKSVQRKFPPELFAICGNNKSARCGRDGFADLLHLEMRPTPPRTITCRAIHVLLSGATDATDETCKSKHHYTRAADQMPA